MLELPGVARISRSLPRSSRLRTNARRGTQSGLRVETTREIMMATTTKTRKAPTRAKQRTASVDTASSTRERTGGDTVALTGAPSPYALAELVTGRRIDWAAVPDRRAVLEDVFDMPFAQIIGSAASPLFYGSTIGPDGTAVRTRPDEPPTAHANDAESPDVDLPDPSHAKTLAELVKLFGERNLADIVVRGATMTRGGVYAELGLDDRLRATQLSRFFDERVLDILFPLGLGYHPPGFSWQDTGRFYNETTEFFDPVQGDVADCYFIAAMSSVAWASPYTIADRTRATASGQESFTHQVSFFGESGWESVEVSDRVLVASGGASSSFAHSFETGEIWPAVYEKAYAKWRFDTADDFPNIPNLAWGDPVAATRALTGGDAYYNWHSGMTSDQLLTLVRSHSSGGRTTTPMVAWSHGAGSPEATDAAAQAGIAASHAYSVLGWMRRTEWAPRFELDLEIPRLIPEVPIPGPGPLQLGGTSSSVISRFVTHELSTAIFERYRLRSVDYIIVRNPWGFGEGTGASTAGGQFQAHDISWWRDVQLGANGVFAIEVDAFRRYFAGTGGTD